MHVRKQCKRTHVYAHIHTQIKRQEDKHVTETGGKDGLEGVWSHLSGRGNVTSYPCWQVSVSIRALHHPRLQGSHCSVSLT